jgi:2-oxoglutarate dehydrogenase E2 component (dihydrolipoamide succinyltransferase)
VCSSDLVSAPRGLVVPVVRNAEAMGLHEIEAEIGRLAKKARENALTLDEMTGGTFTITNGGVFGSMMSTPIINAPQSAILGMHNIVERAVVKDGQIVIRPIMYVALSYDHRIIDGRESVGFLVKVKQCLENPTLLLTGGTDPNKLVLGL